MLGIGGSFAFTIISLYCGYLVFMSNDATFANIVKVYIIWSIYVDTLVILVIIISSYVVRIVSIYIISIKWQL